MPFDFDKPAPGFVCFEWIGQKNYLQEWICGRVACDSERSRGQGFTSADFAFRFKRDDGKIQIVLGEWKYSERYGRKSLRISDKNTDRLDCIYRASLERWPLRLAEHSIGPEALFFDPFDQLMRLQLLAGAMQKHHEMDADIVSVLHV